MRRGILPIAVAAVAILSPVSFSAGKVPVVFEMTYDLPIPVREVVVSEESDDLVFETSHLTHRGAFLCESLVDAMNYFSSRCIAFYKKDFSFSEPSFITTTFPAMGGGIVMADGYEVAWIEDGELVEGIVLHLHERELQVPAE